MASEALDEFTRFLYINDLVLLHVHGEEFDRHQSGILWCTNGNHSYGLVFGDTSCSKTEVHVECSPERIPSAEAIRRISKKLGL